MKGTISPTDMLLRFAVVIAKGCALIIKIFNFGAAATWPGEIALTLHPSIAQELVPQLRKGVILIGGTNGKTTTSLMIARILESQGDRVVHNTSGANLLNGIVSSLISKSNWNGDINADWGIFEVDENSLPAVLAGIGLQEKGKKRIVVLLNLFRDQLDRYGEVDVIAEKWGQALAKLPMSASLILNADDPGIAYLGRAGKRKIRYFGLNDSKHYIPKFEHATDSTFCPNCGARLVYDGIYYSHIGIWKCEKCGAKRPAPTVSEFPSALPGLYNQYNTLAAVSAAQALGVKRQEIVKALTSFVPAFGRQEEVTVDGKTVKLFLSKNPAGFNASLRTVLEMGAKQFLFVLNDRIPDGRDVSWIWDVDFEMLPGAVAPVVAGDRCWDMAVRLKYAKRENKSGTPIAAYEDLGTALRFCMGKLHKGTPLYVLATYSAMLEVRKILKGRKIL
jgi:UDP-N-acetylmuramyl tripeptide synthase